MLEQRIYSVLSNDAGLTALVDKIRPIVLQKDDQIPSMTYQIDKRFDYGFDGNTEFRQSLLETNVYANTLQEARDIQAALDAALQSLPGSEPGITIFNFFAVREIQDFSEMEEDFRINTQYTINLNEV